MEEFTRATLCISSLTCHCHWEAGTGAVGLNLAKVEEEDGSYPMTLKTSIALQISSRSNVMAEMIAVAVEVTSVWKEKGTVTVTVIVQQVCFVAQTIVRGQTLKVVMTAV